MQLDGSHRALRLELHWAQRPAVGVALHGANRFTQAVGHGNARLDATSLSCLSHRSALHGDIAIAAACWVWIATVAATLLLSSEPARWQRSDRHQCRTGRQFLVVAICLQSFVCCKWGFLRREAFVEIRCQPLSAVDWHRLSSRWRAVGRCCLRVPRS